MRYINNILLVSIFLLSLLTSGNSQNLRWSFQVVPAGGNNSTVMVFVQNIHPTLSENIASFGLQFYYQNPQSSGVSFDVTPASNLWASNNGTGSSSLANTASNPNVLIPHNRFASINLIDLTPTGANIPPASAPIHVLSINFSNQNPSSLGWLAESDEVPGMVYADNNFNENDIIVIGQQFAPLPITIKNFSVSKHSDRSAKLDWTTSKEVNSDYFGIERSQDAENWETIGKVAAAGNSDTDRSYDFIDNKLPLTRSKDQVFYYRLRLTDLDGQFKYSDVRGVNFGRSFADLVTIYPNPTAQHINVDLSGMDMENGKIDLSVFDMNGRLMINKNILGNGIELIEVNQLPANTYNVVVRQGDALYQQRIIKID